METVRETTSTDARRHLGKLMDQVTETREPVIIRRRGNTEPVALIPAGDLAGWLETAYLLRSPKNAHRLLEAAARAAKRVRLDSAVSSGDDRSGLATRESAGRC